MTVYVLLHAAHTLPHLLAIGPHAGPTPTGGVSGVGGAAGGAVPKPVYDRFLRAMLELFIFLANLSGGIVVGVAVIRGLLLYAVDLAKRRGEPVPTESIRLSLSRALALALEFQLGADILGTALEPSLQDLLTLAAIVVLRTVLNYFIGREIKEAAQREAGAMSREAPRSGAPDGSLARPRDDGARATGPAEHDRAAPTAPMRVARPRRSSRIEQR